MSCTKPAPGKHRIIRKFNHPVWIEPEGSREADKAVHPFTTADAFAFWDTT